jgi:hypothetical protein
LFIWQQFVLKCFWGRWIRKRMVAQTSKNFSNFFWFNFPSIHKKWDNTSLFRFKIPNTENLSPRKWHSHHWQGL